MAMDFFESQERAKRNTGALVVLFVLAVLGTVAGVHVVLALSLGGGNVANPSILAVAAGSVGAIVLVGTLVKMAQMAGGGRAVAAALGGRQVDPASRDPEERRVLNVVEEMAIASGLPVPPVYIMEEDGINAFAAGNTPKDAVIGVTRGCIRALDRDELQGVMAHEFSHVFHQDMRLNMRLVAWLGGILALSMIGRAMLRSVRFRGSGKRNDGVAVIAAIGIGLFLVGIIGYFFGRLIQSAVSRQREYLADASAVQYTRNADGIAGALEKIARGAGSRLRAPAATEFGHFLFADGVAALFATHPPIEERIARVRGMRGAPPGSATGKGVVTAPVPAVAPVSAVAHAHGGGATSDVRPSVRAARAEIGAIGPAQLAASHAVLGTMPASVLEAAHEPADARAVVCLLVLSTDTGERLRQLAIVREHDRPLAEVVEALAARGRPTPEQRLPLLEACAASLAMLSPAQAAAFRVILSRLVQADGQVDRVEWMVRVLVRQAIDPSPIRRGGGRPTPRDAAIAISTLCWIGARDASGAATAWNAARATAPGVLGPVILPMSECTLDALDAALTAFAGAGAGDRRRLIDAAVAAITADAGVTVDEAEVLRTMCAAIDVPMPMVSRGVA
jgi:Zn-dependent protease with chaperone function